MHVNAAPSVQLESFGIQRLRIVPLADSPWMNRRLVVDRGAELSYFLVVNVRHPLLELGPNVRERGGLSDRIEGQAAIRYNQH